MTKKGNFINKEGTKNFTSPFSISFLSVLHQNKALQNFYERGEHLITWCIKGLNIHPSILRIYRGQERKVCSENWSVTEEVLSKNYKKELGENKCIHKSQHYSKGWLLSKRQNWNAGFHLSFWRAVVKFFVIDSFLCNLCLGK